VRRAGPRRVSHGRDGCYVHFYEVNTKIGFSLASRALFLYLEGR
jgi:hypothetical protein